jgi:hypothetical protein
MCIHISLHSKLLRGRGVFFKNLLIKLRLGERNGYSFSKSLYCLEKSIIHGAIRQIKTPHPNKLLKHTLSPLLAFYGNFVTQPASFVPTTPFSTYPIDIVIFIDVTAIDKMNKSDVANCNKLEDKTSNFH